jgi:hypothetical protein
MIKTYHKDRSCLTKYIDVKVNYSLITYMKGDEVISANSIFKKIKAADKK